MADAKKDRPTTHPISSPDRMLIIEYWSRACTLLLPEDLLPIITAFEDPFLTWSRTNIGSILNVEYSLSDTKVQMRGNDKQHSILCVDHCITCDDIPQNTPFDIEYRMHTFSKFMEYGFLAADSNGKPLIEDWKRSFSDNKGYGIYHVEAFWYPEINVFGPLIEVRNIDSAIKSGDSIVFE